jgi:hypothetical protein
VSESWAADRRAVVLLVGLLLLGAASLWLLESWLGWDGMLSAGRSAFHHGMPMLGHG